MNRSLKKSNVLHERNIIYLQQQVKSSLKLLNFTVFQLQKDVQSILETQLTTIQNESNSDFLSEECQIFVCSSTCQDYFLLVSHIVSLW